MRFLQKGERTGEMKNKRCKTCGGPYPCPKHTIIIDEKTGHINLPTDVTEEQKQHARDIRDAFMKNLR